MDKPIKPTDLMPRSFGGVKNNFSASMQSTGFEDGVPVIYGGDNLNYQLDATGKELDYCEKIVDFINNIPIGKTLTVDNNNKLVYANLATDISGKANISLDNLNADGKARIAVKEYLVTETYIQGDVVLAIIDDEVKLFKSLINNNTGNALSDDTKWEEVKLGGGASRNIGEIVASTIPLTDAGLHLLDGTVIQGSGIYSAFVDYMAELYGDVGEGYYVEWTQPVLSANGTVGGDSFAVLASSEEQYSSQPYRAFEAFDSNASTYWRSAGGTKWLEFYNPQPLKVTNLQYANYYNYPTAGNVQGSNNGVDWTTLTTWTNNSLNTFNIDLSSNTNAYTYYRVNITNTSDGADATIHCVQLNITAQQYVAPEGVPSYFCTEAEWQQSVTDYGVCGKFVYDSVNNTVRLPLVEGFTEGTVDTTVLGDLTEAGLPNIIGYFAAGTNTGLVGPNILSDGPFYASTTVLSNGVSTGTSGNIKNPINFDASRVNSIYGNSSTVQPQSIKVLYYIVVATSTKTDIQVDIDEIATDLNMKVDKSQLVEADVVIETYQSGASWYRLYSSGWCEQGGRIVNSTDGGTSVTLLKPYRDTLYTITTSGYITTNTSTASNNGAAKAAATYSDISTTGFTLYKQSTQPQADWRTCGYVS